MGKEILLHKLSAGGPNSYHSLFKRFVQGFFLFMLSIGLYHGLIGKGINWSVMGMILMAGIFAYVFLEAMIPSRSLQEVFDGGEFLLLRHKRKEVRLPIKEISNYSYEFKSQTPMFHFSYQNEENQLVSTSFICPFNYYQEEPAIQKLIGRIKAAQDELKK